MPLPKLSDKRSGAIAFQIYLANIKDLIFAFDHLYKADISLRRTLTPLVVSPKGVHLRKSCLYFQEIVRSLLLLMVLTFYCQVLSEHC